MKNEVQLIIFLLFGFTLFPFTFVDAEKLESGVTIKAPSTTETEKICDDGKDNDNDGKIDADDQHCAAQGGPSAETCGPQILNRVKCMKQDIEKLETLGNPTCGLQILSGVPINYGRVTLGQVSAEQRVTIKNEGTATATITVKGDSWYAPIFDAETKLRYREVISEPEVTHLAIGPNLDYDNKKSLTDSGLILDQISGGQSIPVYFQFKPSANAPSGSFYQEVTIDLLC